MTTDTAPDTVAPALDWTPALHTDDARMDDTHAEFVAQLNALRAAAPDEQLPLYRAFLDHTVDHFAQEERWMVATGFAPDNCHASHHATILETLRAVADHAARGDTDIIGRLVDALAEWFPQHAATMDAGLAQHLREVGFDSRTETWRTPGAQPPAAHRGCGSAGCA